MAKKLGLFADRASSPIMSFDDTVRETFCLFKFRVRNQTASGRFSDHLMCLVEDRLAVDHAASRTGTPACFIASLVCDKKQVS